MTPVSLVILGRGGAHAHMEEDPRFLQPAAFGNTFFGCSWRAPKIIPHCPSEADSNSIRLDIWAKFALHAL